MLVLGHRYGVANAVLNNGVVDELRRLGLEPIAKEELRPSTGVNAMASIGVDVDVWYSEGPTMFAVAARAVADPSIAGVLYLSMFNCGFDAVIEDVIARRVLAGVRKPYLHLVVDEHSSRVNLRTRLERELTVRAFVCGDCENRCSVVRYLREGQVLGYRGDLCAEYTLGEAEATE